MLEQCPSELGIRCSRDEDGDVAEAGQALRVAYLCASRPCQSALGVAVCGVDRTGHLQRLLTLGGEKAMGQAASH